MPGRAEIRDLEQDAVAAGGLAEEDAPAPTGGNGHGDAVARELPGRTVAPPPLDLQCVEDASRLVDQPRRCSRTGEEVGAKDAAVVYELRAST